jgi:hypothetical protein
LLGSSLGGTISTSQADVAITLDFSFSLVCISDDPLFKVPKKDSTMGV